MLAIITVTISRITITITRLSDSPVLLELIVCSYLYNCETDILIFISSIVLLVLI